MSNSNAKPILRVDKLCKSFGGVVTAKDVTFSVYPGEIKGLIGPNGAGKTTMMNMISGIYTSDSGKHVFYELFMAGNIYDTNVITSIIRYMSKSQFDSDTAFFLLFQAVCIDT